MTNGSTVSFPIILKCKLTSSYCEWSDNGNDWTGNHLKSICLSIKRMVDLNPPMANLQASLATSFYLACHFQLPKMFEQPMSQFKLGLLFSGKNEQI